MTRMALAAGDIVVGVDTHKDLHVAVALDGVGGRLDELSVTATSDGYAVLMGWAAGLGRVAAFGVEGTGSYGAGLARALRRHGHRVIEVSRPPHRGERRAHGKSDPIDAEHAARAVLAGTGAATPKAHDGIVEAVRLVKLARTSAVNAQSQAMNTLKAVLVTAPEDLRAGLGGRTNQALIQACAGLEPTGDIADPAVAAQVVLRSMAGRWLELATEIKALSGDLEHLTTRAAPDLVAAYGFGPDTAGQLLITVGDNPDRIHSEAALAKLCGVSPIPTGSGKTAGRWRLNRGGDRQANAALHRVIIVRMRWHEPTKAYVARRTAEGLSKREIIRCLKRYLAREVYRLLPTPTAELQPAA